MSLGSVESTAVDTQEVLQRFKELSQTVPDTTSSAELWQAMAKFHYGCGIKMASYHHLPPPGALDYTQQLSLTAEGFPQRWVKRYLAEFTEDDPITRHALSATEAFFWSDAKNFAGLTKKEKRYLNELEKEGFGDGLAVPVFGPSGRNGYVGLGFGSNGKRPNADIVTLLSAGCQLGHQHYCHLLLKKHPADVLLSPREAEILNWVARGKSNAVIARILTISDNTVDTHLRRVFGKLGVQDRVTAALRGAALGML